MFISTLISIRFETINHTIILVRPQRAGVRSMTAFLDVLAGLTFIIIGDRK